MAPDCFICTRVNADKLTIDVHAKEGKDWRDLGLSRDIPFNILNFHESQASENMDSDESAPLS